MQCNVVPDRTLFGVPGGRRWLWRLLTLGLCVLAVALMWQWLCASTYRLYLDEKQPTAAAVRSSTRQRFEVRAGRVEPQIVTVGKEHLSFLVDFPWPSQLIVRAVPAGKADLEIAVVEEGARRVLYHRKLSSAAEIALSLPPVTGTLEFISRGGVRWSDPRVEHDLSVIPWLLGLTALLIVTGWGRRRFSFPAVPAGSRASRLLFGGITVVVSTILSLASLEMGLRLLSDHLPASIAVERRDLGEFREDPRWQDSFHYGPRLAAQLNTYCEWQQGDIVRMGFLPPGLVRHPAYRFPFITDTDGFRNQASVPPAVSVAALGDSFTDAMTLPSDLGWPARLGSLLGVNVRNYGTAGFGPAQELLVLKEYVLSRRPRRVVVGFFAGNDLQDAAHFANRRRPGGASGSPVQGWKFKEVIARFDEFYLVSLCKAGAGLFLDRSGDGADPRQVPCDYSGEDLSAPAVASAGFDRGLFAVPVAGHTVRFAFMPPYLERLELTREQLKTSPGWDVTCRSYREIDRLVRAQGGELVVVLIPSKEQVYLPLLSSAFPPGVLQRALRSCLGERASTARLSAMMLNRLALNDLLREFCAGEGIAFLDLTPVLQAKLKAGCNTYFPDDSHWNATGHETAANAIAGFLRAPGPSIGRQLNEPGSRR